MTKIKQVIRFVCGICKKEFKTEQEALKCQSSEIHKATEEIRIRRQKAKEIKKIKNKEAKLQNKEAKLQLELNCVRVKLNKTRGRKKSPINPIIPKKT